MRNDVNVAVLYVARGDDGACRRIAAFRDAYLAHAAGWPHELVFLAKGWSDERQRSSMRDDVSRCGALVIDLPDDGFDWGAYFRAASLLTHSWLCLLNAHTRPCVADWLALLMSVAQSRQHSVVGATASWESPRWHWARGSSMYEAIRGIAHNCRHSKYLSGFPRFPNPHVRSTGVVVAREWFLAFAAGRDGPVTKNEAHALESGRGGLSRFALAQGGALLVVGSDGRCYESPEWPASATFRSGRQANLILRDNRTDQYDAADPALRRRLERMAWGVTQS